jgi:hypothetical protein
MPSTPLTDTVGDAPSGNFGARVLMVPVATVINLSA